MFDVKRIRYLNGVGDGDFRYWCGFRLSFLVCFREVNWFYGKIMVDNCFGFIYVFVVMFFGLI